MPLIILAVGILVLFFLIVKVKLNSFISLLLVAFMVCDKADKADFCRDEQGFWAAASSGDCPE